MDFIYGRSLINSSTKLILSSKCLNNRVKEKVLPSKCSEIEVKTFTRGRLCGLIPITYSVDILRHVRNSKRKTTALLTVPLNQ